MNIQNKLIQIRVGQTDWDKEWLRTLVSKLDHQHKSRAWGYINQIYANTGVIKLVFNPYTSTQFWSHKDEALFRFIAHIKSEQIKI